MDNNGMMNQQGNENQGNNALQNRYQKKSKGAFLFGTILGIGVTCFVVLVIYIVSLVSSEINMDPIISDMEKELIEESAEDGHVINEETLEKLSLLEEAISIFSIYEVDTDTLSNGVYQGLIDSLDDPYSDYYDEDELAEFEEQSSGIYYGVGAYIGYNKEYDYPEFSKIMEGTPAEESGLLAGDLIYEVDGVNCYEMETSDVVPLVKGPQGTSVLIRVYREATDEYVDIEVTRDKIETPLIVSEMLESQIGYIEIMQFETTTYEQFVEAKENLEGQGMEALIIDLRGNPGGNLSTVNDIARELLPEGVIVYTIDKNGERSDYTCVGANEIDIPLVVLTDGNSASASEILAGAVKDYGVGTLVGTTTFGKGIVQRIIDLGDGTAVKLTISEYYTPNGENIHGIGIEPDVEVEWDAEAYVADGTDNQLDKAVEVLNEELGE